MARGLLDCALLSDLERRAPDTGGGDVEVGGADSLMEVEEAAPTPKATMGSAPVRAKVNQWMKPSSFVSPSSKSRPAAEASTPLPRHPAGSPTSSVAGADVAGISEQRRSACGDLIEHDRLARLRRIDSPSFADRDPEEPLRRTNVRLRML